MDKVQKSTILHYIWHMGNSGLFSYNIKNHILCFGIQRKSFSQHSPEWSHVVCPQTDNAAHAPNSLPYEDQSVTNTWAPRQTFVLNNTS